MNILNGDSAAGLFKQAFNAKPNEILVFRDVLQCGPLASYSNMQDWKHDRSKFWNDLLKEAGADPVSFDNSPRDFHKEFNELREANEIKLWMGCALSDHLVLVFLVYLLNKFNIDTNKLSIIQFINHHKNGDVILGLGELHPKYIKQPPDAFKLNESEIDLCLEAWGAITANTPDHYMQLINAKTDLIPTLIKSLKALFYRYPSSYNGLSRWDEILLTNTNKHGPKAARVVGYSMSEGWGANNVSERGLDTVGDVYLFHRLKKLGRNSLSKPLVNLNSLSLPMRETEVAITKFGKVVLDNDKNAVHENGIDDWVGGVHLNSSNGKCYGSEIALIFNLSKFK